MDLLLFSAVKKRLDWLTQRQEVIAQNVANADTPEYRARDLRPFEFRELIRRESAQLNLDITSSDDIGGQRRRIVDFNSEETRRPFETNPDDNSVILEEQLGKMGEVQINHKATVQLYRKHLELLRIAGSPGRR